ncbi:hypothetical protein THARTR1_09091 [Trichoderma harzianum]|uniref:Involucrin repeat protein n=1 Tax=Trichoderma harzianum TaxID=5544 RepID=A0A2K0TX58_TRIHA|nr:hypothetical protein THARTR1_09091 [Trichoderma harzianum]
MPHPRRRSPESSRRRRREKRLSREESLYSSPNSIAPQQMPGSYSADSPQQQQQPYQPPPPQPQPQPQYHQPQQPPPLPLQQQAFPSPPQQQYPYPQQYQHMSLPMPQHQTPTQDAAQPRSRASSGSLSSSPSSSSSSYTEISRVYPASRFGNFISTFVKAPSEVRRRRRRRGSGTKKRRGVFFGGGSNSSHSSINSDMAYGTGFVKKEKDRSTRYSSSVAGSAVSGSRQQQQQQQQQPQQQQQYPPPAANRPSPKLLNEGKRNKTDEEILAIGRQLSDLARRSNEEDLRAAGKTRPSGLASTAAAISALRKSRKEAKKRGLAGSKKHRASSSDESDWESASDDDGDSSESSSSDDSTSALAYGGDSSRSNVALSGFVGAAAGAAATGAVASSVASSRPTYHSRKSSVVDPRLFGPVNSLRGLVHTPCGFGDEQPPPASMSSNRYDNDRPATGGSQADSTHRPGSIPLQQPIPMVPVSNKVFEAGRRDSRNSYRRQLSNSGSLDPTLSGGVAAAAAAAAAAMADQRGPWTEDRIYRDNVKLTRPDPEEDYFQRDQAPFEELERRRANPEVYYNRRNDNDSPRLESDRQVPDYAKDSSNLPRDGRSWMELHPEERKESLKYQTTYDAHMREAERREAQLRDDQLRDAQRQQQQPPQPARATKAGDRNIETTAQSVPKPIVDPFQYQVADDAFNTPQFNTPRRQPTPEIVTVSRVPNFTDPSPAPASAPPPSHMPLRPQGNADIRLSRKDSFEIERAAEERRRGVESESRGRDPRGGYEYEQEEKDARSILDEAKHSTIPVAAVAVASAIAVEEERSRERKRREYSDDGSRDRSRPAKDVVQEDADRYYRESVIARKIASDEIRSRSHSPDESVMDKWEKPSAEESFAIVAPPSMEDREHDDDENPYAPPNADVRIDNEIFPHETDRFRATNGADAARFKSRDASCERERPLLNIVRPTPVPSPDSTSVGLKQPAEVPASREIEKESDSIASSEDEESDAKGEATHSSPSGKSVTWGENSTKRFVVESPESRSRAESPNELAEAEEKPRPRLSKISQWGKIAAMMAAGTAEPTTELDRHTATRSRDLPADDDVNGTPPVPGPKLASPEPEQMPGTYSDDLEFTATVAAVLEKSGFDPNIVIDDPDFRRRGSRPSTNETPVMDRADPEPSAKEPVPVLEDHLERDRGVVADEEELSLADTEESEDEKTQKQRKLNALEKYLQMRQSGEIKPPSQPQESVEPPAVVERPVTPPQNNERRNMLEKFLQRRQSGEIQPPREVLESRGLEPVPEAQDDDEDKMAKRERLEKFLQMRQSSQAEEPETTEAGPRHEPDPEPAPTRTPLHPEALAKLDDSASDFAPTSKSKKKKKKKRRDRLDEASAISSRLDDERSGLSIPGDEGTEISRISVPGDEATVFSVEDWEDWDSSPRSTRRSVVASELSTSSRRSTRPKRRSGTEKDLRLNDGNEPPPYSRDGPTGDHDDDRRPRSRESKSSQYNDNSEKPVSSRKRKDSSGKKPGFLSGIFKSGGKNEVINEKGDSFFEQAGILGAGAGLARALTRSNAADVSSDPENISRDLPGSSREDEDVYPVIASRAIAIDPQYGDLLPLPPSEPGTPLDASLDKLPGLPDSRPGTPVEDRNRRFEKTHRRQRSNQENNLSSSRNRSHSNTAVPLALLRGIGSSPSSPVAAFKPPRTPPRPTSWDSTKEFMPLMLLEHARRGSADPKGEELPPLPPSEVSSEAEGGAMSDREEDQSSALRLRPEDFRSPMPPNDGFSSTDHQLRLQTDIPTLGRTASDEGSEGSTPKADLTYELPVPPTNNTLGEAAAGYEFRDPGPRTIGNDRSLTGDYDEPAPVESTPSSGQSARTVDAQAIPSPTTPTRRFLSPNKDIRHHAEELTSADEPSDDFETARTSPADINDDDDLFEPPPIEPSMLGAIPEFSRPAKFFEDKVPEHSELASVDKVIETLPSIENVPKDQAQARQGSPSYLDPLLESAEESSTKGKNKSLLPDADIDLDFAAQPTADETLAAFVGVPEPVLAKEPTLDADRGFSDEYTPIKERKAQPVMVEDESEPEAERYTSGPELELDKEPAAVFEPIDEVVEAPYTETVDIVPVSEELSYDAIAESTQHSDSEGVEEIVIGTMPAAKSRTITEAATEVKAGPVLEEPEPVQRDAGQEYPRKPEPSLVIEDSEESEEEDETEEEEDDSEDSEESEEESEEEEEHAVADVGKHVGEEGHAVRDMTASVETLGAVSVVSSSSKKSKKKKKKKKKKRKRKKKSKAAAAAAALAAAEASHDTPIQHAKEPAESTIIPVVEPATETPSEVTRALPTEFDQNDSEPLTQPAPIDAIEAVEEVPLDLAKESPIQEPVSEASEPFTREIAEEPIIEKAQEVAASPEFTPREGLEPVSEPTPLAETEEPQTIPSTAVESANNNADGLEDEPSKWANTDSEPIPHSDHARIDEADTLSPELSDEQDGEKRSIQVEDETIAVEIKPETLAPLQEEFPVQEEVSAPVSAESDLVSTDEVPADLPAKGEDFDSDGQDRELMVTDEVEPAAEEMPIESPAVAEEHVDADVTDPLASDADELASVPREESPSADREWAATPEYEDTMLPTIMEEPGLEGIEGEDEFDRDAPFSDQLSPILEESLEDLLEDSAPEKTPDQESIEPTLETIQEESAWSIGRAEDQPEQQIADETRYLEPIGEESDATAAVEDISLEPQMDESVPRSVGEIAETPDSKPLDWVPQLPSFSSDISEPLFTQGDAPSEYPTQQSPASYEPTQMDESFAVPAEPSRTPPPVPDTADEGDFKAIEPAYSEVPVAPEEPSRAPPPVPNAADEGDSKADEFESPEAVVIPEEPSRPPPSIPSIANEAESLDVVETPEEPSRSPPPVPSAADEGDSKAPELEPLESLVESEVDVPALEHQENIEEHVANFTDTAEVAPAVEERELVDEQLSTAAPDATIQESELKEVNLPAEADNEERQETSVSDLEPTKQEQEPEMTPDEHVEPPSFEAPLEAPIESLPETREFPSADESQSMEEQQPDADTVEHSDLAPHTDLADESLGEDQPVASDSAPPMEPETSQLPALQEEHKAQDDMGIEQPTLQEPETIPLQEADRELDLEPKAEQEAVDDGLQPPMNNTDLENEDSGDKSREVDVDTTSDTHLETGTLEDARPIYEEEHRPEMENNDNENLDAEKREEKSENPEQSVELDSTAEIVAPSTTPPNAEEKVELEYPPQTEDSEQMNLAQDGAIAPVSTELQDPSGEFEPATEAEQQTEDPLAPQEAQPPTEKEINESENERQGSAVAEDLDQFEAPAEIIKEDSIDTTLSGSDPVTDANDASRLDNDTTVYDEARSDPTDVVDSGISEETRDIIPVVEDKEAAGDVDDLQPEVPSATTDAPAEEAQLELKPEELPLEQASDEQQQEPKSDEPEPESVVEESDRGLNPAFEEIQQKPTLEEIQQVPVAEELQQEPVSEIQEPKLEEPHHDSSDDESEHESQPKELTTDSPLQDVDEATAKKIAKKERKKARRRARAAAAAVEEAVVDPVAWKDEAQYQSATEEVYNSHPLDSASTAEQDGLVPDILEKEAGGVLKPTEIAQPDTQAPELDTISESHALESTHDKSVESLLPESTVAESDVPVDDVAADSEQLAPAEAISLPTEEPLSTEPVDQPQSEAVLPTEPQEEISKEPTEEPQQKSFVPDSPEVRQSRTWETDKSRKTSSVFLSVPGAADSSGSEEDSDDDTSYVSDMSYQHSEVGYPRYGGPNDSTSRLTGFEVTAAPRVEGHAHRDRHRKKKKKKGGKKHKRKKSRSGGSERGSDPSSSLPSLPQTSNPNLAGSVPNVNDSQPSISDEHVDKEQKPSSSVGEGAVAEPPATGAGGSRDIDELLSEFADDPELLDPPESQRVGSITAPLDTIPEDASGEDVGSPRLKEATNSPDNQDSELSRPSGDQMEEEPENAWDMFTGNWGKSSGKRSESDLARSIELAPDERPPQDLSGGKQAQMIQDAALVEEPSEMSTPQRRDSQTDNTASDEPAGSELQAEKRASSFSGSHSPKGKDPKSMRPGSASSQGSNQWLGFLSERFGPKKKKTRDRDKDPIGEDDREDPNEESFLGNPALRKSGDERSWETKIETIDDFLQRSGSPTTPKKRKRRQGQSDTPTTPKRTESIVEAGDDDGDVIERKFKRGEVFGGQLVDSPILEAMEVLGPFELLKRNAQVEDPIGGLLREASEISVLPPMDMMSEISDYDLSDYRLSPRGLPSVEELPEAEAEATASEVGFYRDSGFSGSPPSRSRRHSTSTIPFEDNEEKVRDSGVDADWLEAAMAQLKTPEPMNRTPERQPQRRLRRSTLGGQKLRDSTSLREAANQDPEKKTIPGTRERVLTGTGTRPETPTGRTSPTRKGYGAITGMGFGRLSNGRVSPMPGSTERLDTPPALKRSATSPVTSAPLRSLRRAVSAQIGPGLQRPESPSVPLMPAATEQPRSVSDSKIPSATRRQTGDEARADPGRGTPNSGLVRQRTPERLKFSQDGSTVRSSSNPTPPLLRRAERRFSLRQPNSSTSSIAPNPIPSPMPATDTSTNPSPIPTPTPTAKPAPKPSSEAPVANEGRVRAKDKPDVYDGFGEGRIGSPLSPTRPHSMRRRQSMQVLELEARVEQLIAENRLLSDARHSTDQHLSHRVVTALSDRDTQIESLKQTLKFLRGEVSRLTEVNDGLSSANAELANKDNSRYADLQVHADRGENQDALMQALRDKDTQIADLTAKLDAAKEKIRELQRQILESKAADVQFLNIKDEDYFDHRCQQLCSHVQQWVLRFSKFSDMRACRLTSEINDEKIIDRLDNAVLDGSDVDRYLNDRVRRRDIFMSMTMNMIWEFVFTRYLFGMDREQRQKLKSLEKLLTEVGPPQAVRQWRAVTLTLLSKRDTFKRQRDLDTEAVVQAIYQTLCKVLPPPSNLEAQIQAQLRRVMHEAVHLSIEMRTQKAEYMMLPPLQPEYDADGELVQTVQFNASMMHERSASSMKLTNEELEARGAIVRVVLFPLVVKKGDDDGSNDEEIVVHPAQVLIARSKLTRQPTPSDGGRVSTGTGRLSGGTNSPSTRMSDVI